MRNLVLLSAFLLSGCIAQALTSGNIAFSDGNSGSRPLISSGERAVIHDYCASHAGSLPVVRRQDARALSRLHRGGTLPAGIALDRLPQRLERRLSPLPRGYVRVLAGTDVLVVGRRSGVIADLARGVCDPSGR